MSTETTRVVRMPLYTAEELQQQTYKYRGVCWHKKRKKWVAQIQVAGRMIWLGDFTFETLAATAYDTAAEKYFGDFARPNFL